MLLPRPKYLKVSVRTVSLEPGTRNEIRSTEPDVRSSWAVDPFVAVRQVERQIENTKSGDHLFVIRDPTDLPALPNGANGARPRPVPGMIWATNRHSGRVRSNPPKLPSFPQIDASPRRVAANPTHVRVLCAERQVPQSAAGTHSIQEFAAVRVAGRSFLADAA